jgi:hypothetical protein
MKKTKRYYVVIFDKKWLEGLLGSEHDELSEAQKALNEAEEMGGIFDVREGRFVQLKEVAGTGRSQTIPYEVAQEKEEQEDEG